MIGRFFYCLVLFYDKLFVAGAVCSRYSSSDGRLSKMMIVVRDWDCVGTFKKNYVVKNQAQ